MTVMILGGTGFIGRHLQQHCRDQGDSVVITGRKTLSESDYVTVDVLDLNSLLNAFQYYRPKQVYHLAGYASNRQSRLQPEECYQVNVMGTLNVLRAMKEKLPTARLLITGSSAEYGRVDSQLITENSPLNPISPYGVSRVAATLMGSRERFSKKPIETVLLRLFNIFGPGQNPEYICSEFALEFVKAKLKALTEFELVTGNLDLERDFSSVYQAVIGLRKAMYHARAFEIYNLCSAWPRPLRSIIQCLEEHSQIKAKIHCSDSKIRLGEAKRLIACADKLFKETQFQVDHRDFKSCLIKTFDFTYNKYVSLKDFT